MAHKQVFLTVLGRRPKPLPANDWMEQRSQTSQFVFDRPQSFLIGNLGPYPCGTCFPEMDWLYAFTGGSYLLYGADGEEIGIVDDDGVLTHFTQMGTGFPIVVDAVLSSPGIYTIPSDAAYIIEVLFDYLYATPEIHWDFIPPRTISVNSPIDSETVVRVSYVSL